MSCPSDRRDKVADNFDKRIDAAVALLVQHGFSNEARYLRGIGTGLSAHNARRHAEAEARKVCLRERARELRQSNFNMTTPALISALLTWWNTKHPELAVKRSTIAKTIYSERI